MTSTMPMTQASAPAAPPRRKLGARLSGGHMLMIVSGIAAFVLVFALLGRGQAQVRVAVATGDISADTALVPSLVKVVSVPADSPLVESLMPYDAIGKETRYTVTRIGAGTPISKAQLSPSRAAVQGEQFRETVIKVDRAFVGGGRINKNDRIDVISVNGDGLACRVAVGLRVTSVEASGGGALGGSSGDAAVSVAIEKDGDDLRLASTMGQKIQVILSTGAPEVSNGQCFAQTAKR